MMGPIANFSRRKFSKGNGCAIVEMAAVIFPHKGKGLASELDVLFNGTKSLFVLVRTNPAMNLKPKRQGLTDDNITATVLFIPQVVAANGNGRSYRGFAQKLPFRTYCAIDIACLLYTSDAADE